MTQLTFQDPTPIKSVGLTDGKEFFLHCSNCQKECMSFKVTRPNSNISWRIRSSCAFGCQKADKTPEMSFPITINGTGNYGPCFKPHPQNPDEIQMTTSITDIKEEQDSEGSIQTFYTKGI